MGCYIGIDGGGTKTAIIVSGEGADRAIELGGASWREHGVCQVVSMIHDAISASVQGEIAGIAAGMPCVDESSEGDMQLRKAFKDAFGDTPVLLVNDVEVGWAGALELRPGVHLVAGTGAIAFGKDEDGNSGRAGGWHEFFSDEGSAQWIGRHTMSLFSKQSDGRLPRGALYDIVREQFGIVNDMDFIDYAVRHLITDRKSTAKVQLLCEKAALLGDTSALELYERAAHELSILAFAIKEKLNFGVEWTVSYSGGVFKAGELILGPLSRVISENGGRLVPPARSPVEGALLLARHTFS